MESSQFECAKGTIHALKMGHGPKLLIALHGFADRARMFAVLEKALGRHYRIVAFDLPFHGQTTWNASTFDREDLLAIVRQIAQAERAERFALMGFSFGARLVQGMLPALAPQIERLWLLSPDGVSTKGMRVAVRTPLWIRKAIFRLLRNPHWFLRLVRFAGRMRLIPAFIDQFLQHNLSRPERRARVYACWMALNAFYARRRDTRDLLKRYNIETDIMLGARDQMIRAKAVYRIAADIPHVRVQTIDAGHRIVGELLAQKLADGDY